MRSSVLMLALLLMACGDRTPPAETETEPATSAAPAVDRAPSGVAPASPQTEADKAAPPPVIAAPPPTKADIRARYTPHLNECLNTGDAARGITWAMAECVGDELKLQDGALNAEYQRVMRPLAPDRQESLRAAERAWIQQRNATCLAKRTGGTLDQVNVLFCHVDQTVSRTIELERMGVR